MAGRTGATVPSLDGHAVEISRTGNSNHAHWPERKLAARTADNLPAIKSRQSLKTAEAKREGKRPGLDQNHFPGCVLEAFEQLDAWG